MVILKCKCTIIADLWITNMWLNGETSIDASGLFLWCVLGPESPFMDADVNMDSKNTGMILCQIA